MTPRQIVNVDLLKAASQEFTTMRGLAMWFAGLLRGGDIGKLDVWFATRDIAGFTPCEVSEENCARISTRFGTPSLNLGATDKSKARSID